MTANRGSRPAFVLRALIAAIAVVTVACMPVSGPQPGPTGLFSDGLAIDPANSALVVIPAGSPARFVAGSRVLSDPASRSGRTAALDTAGDRRWLESGEVPGGRAFASMNQQALLDLRSLTAADGAVIAGWTPAWRYVWPRDASFAVAAYAATGHHDDAVRVLSYLARIAPADGRWQARYLPDGSGAAPDGRGVQLDGAGWVLWATGEYVAGASPSDPVGTAEEVRKLWPMVSSSADAIASSLGRDGLPPASPDYWERSERSLTLGIAAPDLAGLRAAAALAEGAGRPADAARWAGAADRLQAGMARQFGTDGWHRTRGGEFDAAVTFTLPPFVRPAVTDPATVLDEAFAAIRNPNGGVRPGANWHRDGVSWTPETALFALAFAATGDRAKAESVLTWLSDHRTGLGSLPEKVNPDGSPAAVAPLAWTAALVLLASSEL